MSSSQDLDNPPPPYRFLPSEREHTVSLSHQVSSTGGGPSSRTSIAEQVSKAQGKTRWEWCTVGGARKEPVRLMAAPTSYETVQQAMSHYQGYLDNYLSQGLIRSGMYRVCVRDSCWPPKLNEEEEALAEKFERKSWIHGQWMKSIGDAIENTPLWSSETEHRLLDGEHAPRVWTFQVGTQKSSLLDALRSSKGKYK